MYSKLTIIIMMIIFLLYTFVLLQISSIYIYICTFKCAQLDRVGNQLFNLLNLGEQTQV